MLIVVYLFVCLLKEVEKSQIGKLIVEGKTKRVFEFKSGKNLVYVLSKDRITAGK